MKKSPTKYSVNRPPKLGERLLSLILPEHKKDILLGDFAEYYFSKVKKQGRVKALIWYWGQFFISLPSFIHNSTYFGAAMFFNYLKIAYRNLYKQKFYSAVNISGLTLGIAICMLISLYVIDELSFDRFHANNDRIFRVVENQYYAGQDPFPVAVTPPPLAPSLKNDYPDIAHATRVNSTVDVFEVDNQTFSERGGAFVDPAFFDIFSFNLISGTRSDALSSVNQIVLSERLANKYFPNESPIGKAIRLNGQTEVTVTGVMENTPQNSHLRLSYLRPFADVQSNNPGVDTLWNSNFLYTYVQLTEGADEVVVDELIRDQLTKNGITYDASIFLQPLTAIHLDPVPYVADLAITANKQYVIIFSIVAAFILLIACINFMNLSTARSAKRAKEVGMRKAIGAIRKQIVSQFLGESMLTAIISTVLAILLAQAFLPFFNQIAAKELSFNMFSEFAHGINVVAALILFAIITGFIAGSYPAFYLSSFKPVTVLKGTLTAGKRGHLFRKVLVIGQFTTSIILISGTLIIYNQLDYIRNKNLGYNKENIIYFPLTDGIRDQYTSVKNALEQHSAIKAITASSTVPTNVMQSGSGYDWEGKSPDTNILLHSLVIDHDFVSAMDITMAEGRPFSENFASDSISVILNQEAVNVMGIEQPVGKTITSGLTDFTIVGVVEDFHFKPIHHKIEPLIMFRYGNGTINNPFGVLSVRTETDDIEDLLPFLERTWNTFEASAPFSYTFLDDDFDQLYRAEQRTGIISRFFAFFAIFVSALGLFGLSLYTIERRTKELGIRKVLGASIGNLYYLISRDFGYLIIISLIISIPIAYVLMDHWLSSFAYSINISIDTFIIAGFMGVGIGILTVSYQALKASFINPTDALNRE